MDIDSEARMLGDTAADAEVFISKWRKARYVLHTAGLIPDLEALYGRTLYAGIGAGDIGVVQASLEIQARKEMNDMMDRRLSPSVFEFIKQMPMANQPRTCDEVIGVLAQWIESQNRKSSHTPVINAGGWTTADCYPSDFVTSGATSSAHYAYGPGGARFDPNLH